MTQTQTQTQTRAIVRHLGGESGHRSFFGGSHSKTRLALLGLFIIGGMVITVLAGWPGLLVGLVGVAVTLLVTARTHRGTIAERARKRRRWKQRVSSGTDAFDPYDVGEFDQREQAARVAKGREGKWAALRALAAMRANPDGADGMGWLQYGRGVAGIAWHAPVGERGYLSVVFAVTGQLRGIESTSVMSRAAEAWGAFLASRAVPSVLVEDVQTVTRVLPADTALQEFWVLNSLDLSAPADAIASYEEVLRRTGDGAMVQRHFITIKWPLTPAFYDAARKYGEGRDGWRGLMREEIASARRGLTEARLGHVDVLSARQVAAVVLHQQNPSRPIDYVADVHPSRLGVASHDEFSAHVVSGTDPATGEAVEWWHRTAKIEARALATAPRTQLWMLDLVIGRDLPFVRSVSFHIHLVPAGEAKAAAQRDLVRDQAEAISKSEAGRVDLDETGTAMSASKRRRIDLRAGTGHQGAAWVGYVTISARSRDELARASRQLEETCSTGLGIEYLDWQDSYQAAASGTTWPIGRGISATDTSFSARVYRVLAGKSEKEAIS
ncbi:SCO6880 family protein [Agromyces bauzanensis]